MLNSCWILPLVLIVQPGLSPKLPSAPPTEGRIAQVAKLITQLGSSRFKEREAAGQALDTIGSPALDALRKATEDKDPEIRRRAEILAHKIYKRVQTAQLLEPKRVRLVYKDVLVSEAIEDFAQKTGFAIKLGGARMHLGDRKLTLDTGETSFWDAYEQFCQKAGLSDRLAVPVPASHQEIRMFNGQGGVPMRAQVLVSKYHEQVGNPFGALTLVDGKLDNLPTCRTGAVRFRAVPATGTMWAQGKGDTFFVLEVTPEPKLAWQSIVDLHIDRAVDEQGQNLSPVLATGGEGGDLAAMGAAAVQGNNVIIIDGETGQPVSGLRDVPVRFKAGAKPSQVLKEVSGSVTAQVQTPVQTVLAVDNILKATGRTVKGSDGETLKVLEAVHQPNGYVRIKLEFTDPAQGAVAGAGVVRRVMIMRNGNAIVRNRVMFRRGRMQESVSPNDASWVLFDAEGRRIQLAIGPEMVANPNGDTELLQLTYRPREGQPEAAKLVYSARRNVVIEVPFTLKDVPVTKPAAAAQTQPADGQLIFVRPNKQRPPAAPPAPAARP